ncbi:TetR/AcrR family transcriptional regulator [Mycolicibacterium arenosum]|uniref:TetR/AcrR family transcriptional regulator n=1 Tax=Mycolicibacterium arenosum TaxID=2952157 RepID=A0ABT1LZK0_9MYCO|nr:TetR/AcrR family transcriptional regulator [Mycolicibacterium sp. CAU 1645]MCP9271032.1 TetR/AcrR family transcriptional regulator [Mycolicibacterium sp. CAU 1645]
MSTKRQRQGESSRELILDVTERLMATKGYAATSVSDIRAGCGLPASSIYWHFGSKQGVLAAVMERGAERFFGAIPRHGDAAPDIEAQLAATAKLLAEHPEFLRLVYLLALERNEDPDVAAAVRRVRGTAAAGFRAAIATLLPPDVPPDRADHALDELTALAMAISDGVFIADHVEPDATDIERMYRRLLQSVTALLPILLEEE